RGEGKKVSDCLRTALKEYNLKFSTILNDPDLASFRALPELGGEDIGESFRRDLKLISEVQAPFRGVRRFFYLAFIAAAGISTFFTVPRLVRAILGGGIAVLVALLVWDNKKEEQQLAQITRDETLSRLPLRLSTSRVVELVQLRDTYRPLLRRGVLLVPVIWDESRRAEIEKKGFGTSRKAAAALPSIGVVSPAEWERWIRDQQISEGVTPGEDVYIILRLDGRVRRSGKGIPEWAEILKELPPMEALLSKLER
ncbi:Protein LOW PSII ACCUMULATION 1, chloroplastic, partial [Linum grandiflorum]